MNGKYVDTPSEFIVYEKATYSLANDKKNDVLDAPGNK